MFIKKIHLKTKRGSILAYSLVVLAIMIGIVTTMSISSVIEKKSASSTDFSVQAYQTADSGIQLAIKGINKEYDELMCTQTEPYLLFSTHAIHFNDGTFTKEEREIKLQELFNGKNIQLKFINNYPMITRHSFLVFLTICRDG